MGCEDDIFVVFSISSRMQRPPLIRTGEQVKEKIALLEVGVVIVRDRSEL